MQPMSSCCCYRPCIRFLSLFGSSAHGKTSLKTSCKVDSNSSLTRQWSRRPASLPMTSSSTEQDLKQAVHPLAVAAHDVDPQCLLNIINCYCQRVSTVGCCQKQHCCFNLSIKAVRVAFGNRRRLKSPARDMR